MLMYDCSFVYPTRTVLYSMNRNEPKPESINTNPGARLDLNNLGAMELEPASRVAPWEPAKLAMSNALRREATRF